VVLKTIFRSFRKYFYFKFDSMMNFRKLKRRINYKNNYLDLIQEFVESHIPPDAVNTFTPLSLSNHLAALIHPKEINKKVQRGATVQSSDKDRQSQID